MSRERSVSSDCEVLGSAGRFTESYVAFMQICTVPSLYIRQSMNVVYAI